MKRLRLLRVRTCARCRRGAAELGTDDGDRIVVPLDREHARVLAGAETDLRPLADVVLELVTRDGGTASDLVLDVAAGRLRALLSIARGDATEVISCAPSEGLTLAVRGTLPLYATEEALAHAAAAGTKPARPGGPDGSDTLH